MLFKRALSQEMPMSIWLEACFVEKPWRLAAKREDLAGISADGVVRSLLAMLRDTREDYLWDNEFTRITLPAYTEHDAPALPLYEYAKSEFRGQVEQKG